jgi:hypothetical protein
MATAVKGSKVCNGGVLPATTSMECPDLLTPVRKHFERKIMTAGMVTPDGIASKDDGGAASPNEWDIAAVAMASGERDGSARPVRSWCTPFGRKALINGMVTMEESESGEGDRAANPNEQDVTAAALVGDSDFC